MSEVLQHLKTGKFAKFVTTISTLGDGPLHLLEDVETGLLKAEPELSQYRVVAQEVIDEAAKVVDDVAAATSSDPNLDPPVPQAPPANLSPSSPATAAGAQPAV